MKKIILSVCTILASYGLFGQAPQKMSYQAVVRDNANTLVSNSNVGMKISILKGSASGSAVYVETQSSTSNANGLVSLEIGNGTVVSGDFSAIDWANGSYFIKTETDPTGGTNYSISGTSQLLSVPYALHASNGMKDGTASGEMLYWDGTDWVNVAPGQEGDVLTFTGGVPTWNAPNTGGQSGVITHNGFTYEEVTNPVTGKTWLDRNLGATQVATSSTDSLSYGDLYQWGRDADGHQLRTSSTTTALSSSDNPGHGDFITSTSPDWRSPQNDNLWQGVNGINNPCPSGYRLPTFSELNTERQSWSSDDAAGAFNSPLKLPVAGYRNPSNGTLSDVGSRGIYWTSTVYDVSGRILLFNSSNVITGTNLRAYGSPVRCIKD